FIVLFYLSDKPTHARWLHDGERDALLRELDRSATDQAAPHTTLLAALKDARLWLLSAIYFSLTFGLYSFGYWMPKLLKSVSGYTDTRVALLSAIPYAIAAITMIVARRHSDRTGERRIHASIAAML